MERIFEIPSRYQWLSIHTFLSKILIASAIMIWLHPSNIGAFSDITPPPEWQKAKEFRIKLWAPTPKEIDLSSGFIPFSRNYMDPVHANSEPAKDEITDLFRVSLAKGEYEPFILALYGLEDIKNIKIDIRNVMFKDRTMGSHQFEVRKIENRAILSEKRKKEAKRYRLIPSLLKLTSFIDLKKGSSSAFWITAYASPSDTTGSYSGNIVISKDEKILRELRLDVDILPFILEEVPDRLFSALYTPCSLSPDMERNARLLLNDMRAHGMTSYSPIMSAWGAPLAFDAEGNPSVAHLLNHLQWAKEEGFWGPTILNISKSLRTGRFDLDANYTKFEEHIDVPNLKKLVIYLESQRKKNGWPEIIYLPIDEPGCFTDQAGTRREEIAVLLLKALKDMNARGATTVADLVDKKHRKLPRWQNVAGWWEKIKPYCPVRIYQNGYPEGETSLEREMEDAKLREHDVMLYENDATMGIDPYVSRMYFGFYGWRTEVNGLTAWTYPLLGNATAHHAWIDSEEKRRQRLRYFKDENWRPPQTTVCWEMVREGIDDAKYLYLLKKRTARNKTIQGDAEKLLRRLFSAVDSTKMSQKKPECDWSGEKFAQFRKNIVDLLLKLPMSGN